MAVPDLRTVGDDLWDAVHEQIEQHKNPNLGGSPVGQKRKKPLLSGLIRCSCCGSAYTISGKDYYRCAGQKERGTCSNILSVRKGSLETVALSILQHHLLSEIHSRLFVEESGREVARITAMASQQGKAIADRLSVVVREIENLTASMLAGVLSPTLVKLLSEREAEKARLEAALAGQAITTPAATILSHPNLLTLFQEKVGKLCDTLNDETVRGEAAGILSQFIESVTIYPGQNGTAAVEVVAKVEDLVVFAPNGNAAPRGGVSSSMAVVAGTGFEPVTFRL